MSVKCQLSCVIILFTVLLYGCSSGSIENPPVSDRYLFNFLFSDPVYNPNLQQLMTLQTVSINNRSQPVSRIRVNPALVKNDLGVGQPVLIKRKHRYTGVSFPLRTSSAPCTVQAIIFPADSKTSYYLFSEPLILNHTRWTQQELPFNDFHYVSTRLESGIDSFKPVRWESFQLTLIFEDATADEFIVEWGPVKLIRQNKRYYFD